MAVMEDGTAGIEGQTNARTMTAEAVRALVIELGSYARAAEQLGISRQRVHQLAGPHLVQRVEVCPNCSQAIPPGRVKHGMCGRCYQWAQTHETPWSAEAAYLARHAQQTHCKRGHPLTPDNVYVMSGVRNCRRCTQARKAAWYRRRRANLRK